MRSKRDGVCSTIARMKDVVALIACSLGCIAVGGVSALLSPMGEWYEQLAKPTWMPPGWLFGPVWTVLYAIMGVALFLVLQKGWNTGGVKWAVTLFAIQLALNFCWSPLFFRFHSLGGSLTLIIALWLMIGWTAAAFWSVRDWAGVLLLPYWAWVTFATALNASIWRMN
jgi:tryptophan-rich sensory protein